MNKMVPPVRGVVSPSNTIAIDLHQNKHINIVDNFTYNIRLSEELIICRKGNTANFFSYVDNAKDFEELFTPT